MFEGPTHTDETAAWRQFWTGRAGGGEHRYRDPQSGAVLEAYWQDYFADCFSAGGEVVLADLACGEGELLRLAGRAAGQFDATTLKPYCADIARDAVALAANGLPGAAPVVADCARLPVPDRSFDCVVSQFGLEYAGDAAFGEAARTVGDAGRFHALVHCEGGAVERACSEVAALLGRVLDSGLFDSLARYAETIPRTARGEASAEEAQACVTALRDALEAVERAVAQTGHGPARDHVARLVADTRTLASRLAAYAPGDVAAWIAGQRADVEAFHHRMTSMVRVARTAEQMQDLAGRLEAAGLAVSALDTVAAPQDGAPLAWVLDAARAGPA